MMRYLGLATLKEEGRLVFFDGPPDEITLRTEIRRQGRLLGASRKYPLSDEIVRQYVSRINQLFGMLDDLKRKKI